MLRPYRITEYIGQNRIQQFQLQYKACIGHKQFFIPE